MAQIQIRRASIEQLDDVVPLFDGYRQFYKQASDLPGARRFLGERLLRGESVILVAYIDEQAVGFTQLYPLFSSVSMERVWVLNDLFVKPDLRGHGVGEALLEQAATFSQSMGAKGLALETEVTNVGAQRLYERNGYHREDDVYHYFRPTR